MEKTDAKFVNVGMELVILAFVLGGLASWCYFKYQEKVKRSTDERLSYLRRDIYEANEKLNFMCQKLGLGQDECRSEKVNRRIDNIELKLDQILIKMDIPVSEAKTNVFNRMIKRVLKRFQF